jgi:tetratricopeptide (TPR) repeat protein
MIDKNHLSGVKPSDELEELCCTEFGNWPNNMDFDSSDKELEAIYSHAESCPYHATLIERSNTSFATMMREVRERLQLVPPYMAMAGSEEDWERMVNHHGLDRATCDLFDEDSPSPSRAFKTLVVENASPAGLKGRPSLAMSRKRINSGPLEVAVSRLGRAVRSRRLSRAKRIVDDWIDLLDTLPPSHTAIRLTSLCAWAIDLYGPYLERVEKAVLRFNQLPPGETTLGELGALCVAEGLVKYHREKYAEARTLFEQAKVGADLVRDAELATVSRYYLGRTLFKLTSYEGALEYIRDAKSRDVEAGNKARAASMELDEGWLHFLLGDVKEAQQRLDNARGILAGQADAFIDQGNALSFQGRLYREDAQYQRALDCYFEAIKIYEEYDPGYRNVARCRRNIAVIYRIMARELSREKVSQDRRPQVAARIEELRAKALAELEHAREIYRFDPSCYHHGLGILHITLALLHFDAEELDQAAEEAQNAYEYGRAKGDFIVMAEARVIQSGLALEGYKGVINAKRALRLANEAIHLGEQTGQHRRLLARAYICKGHALLESPCTDVGDARLCYEEAMTYLVPEDRDYLRDLLDSLEAEINLKGHASSFSETSSSPHECADEVENHESAINPTDPALLAIFAPPFELRHLTRDLASLKRDMCGEIFESAITQLNAAWRNGEPPQILKGYIKTIEDLAGDSSIDPVPRLRGTCAAAVVKYALGDLRESYELGARNWAEAQRLESGEESELKWMASYGYFNSVLFLGGFKKAMNLMASQWSRYYAPLDNSRKERLRERLSGHLTLNPILSIPRHLILAAAFNERPCFGPMYWPSQAVFDKLAPEERECKLRWVETWYEEAKLLCESEPTSLSFSHAYSGFYFTLLLLESGMPEAYLHEKIKEAFDAIDDSSPTVARYVKYGFRGVYNLVCGEDEKALESLSRAATFSALSGNRFADCIFMCSHAVAAARLNRPSRHLMPHISYYLKEAERLAQKINRPFYKNLYYGAKAAVYQLCGEKAKARRYAAWSKQSGAQNRILKIFYKDGQKFGTGK